MLFNNAGISPLDDASVLDTSLDAWQRVQDVNLKSVFLCCKHGIPHLLETGGGSVINTASFVAVMGAATSQISYTASKGGVLALSRELGVEFARRNVRVNALCPGPVDTPLLQELYANDPEQAARRMVHVPMGRFAEAVELANAALVPGLGRSLVHHRLDVPGRRRPRRRLRHPAVAVAAPSAAGCPLVPRPGVTETSSMASTELSRDHAVFAAAMAAETAHLFDDGLLNPHNGVTDVPSTLIAVAIAVAAVALYGRLALGARRARRAVRARRARRRARHARAARDRPGRERQRLQRLRPHGGGARCWCSRRRWRCGGLGRRQRPVQPSCHLTGPRSDDTEAPTGRGVSRNRVTARHPTHSHPARR